MTYENFLNELARRYSIPSGDELLSKHRKRFGHAINSDRRGRQVVSRLEEFLGRRVRGMTIVDVGSEFGGVPINLAKAGANAIAIDVNPFYRKLALAYAQDTAEVRYELCAPDSPEFVATVGEKVVDAVTMIGPFEHIVNVSEAVRNLQSVLRPGGVLFATLPNPLNAETIGQEPHCGAFGLSILPASMWHGYTEAVPQVCYRTFDEYEALFHWSGFESVTILPGEVEGPGDLSGRVENDVDTLNRGFDKQRFRSDSDQTLLRSCLDRHIAHLRADLKSLSPEAFARKYLVRTYYTFATRDTRPRATGSATPRAVAFSPPKRPVIGRDAMPGERVAHPVPHVLRREVLLKADDLHATTDPGCWSKLFDLVARYDAVISTGLISGRAAAAAADIEREMAWLKPYLNDPRFEFWNHGHVHTRAEFLGSEVEQLASMQKHAEVSQKIFGRPLGLFGAPFNSFNSRTIRACAQSGIKIAYYGNPTSSVGAVPIRYHRSCERNRDPSFDYFVRKSQRPPTSEQSCWVLQIHPTRWTAAGMEEIERILAWLVQQGVLFVTAAELVASETGDLDLVESGERRAMLTRFMEETPPPVDSRCTQATPVELEKAAVTAAAAFERSSASNMPKYFVNKYAEEFAETSGRLSLIREYAPQLEAGDVAIDIGCGAGDWCMAYLLADPRHRVLALEPHVALAEAASSVAEALGVADRFTLVGDSVESYGGADPAPISWSNRAMMFTDHAKYVQMLSRVTPLNGCHFCGYQSLYFYLQGLDWVLKAKNIDNARRRLNVIWSSMEAAAGVNPTGPAETSYSSGQLTSLFGHFGFEVVHELRPAQEYSETFEQQYIWSPIFRRTKITAPGANGTTISADYLCDLIAVGLDQAALELTNQHLRESDVDHATVVLLAACRRGDLDLIEKLRLRIASAPATAQGRVAYVHREYSQAVKLLSSVGDPRSQFLAFSGSLRAGKSITKEVEVRLETTPHSAYFWVARLLAARDNPVELSEVLDRVAMVSRTARLEY